MKQLMIIMLLAVVSATQAATFKVHDGLTTSKSWVEQTAKVATCVLARPEFINDVKSFAKYDYTTKTPAQVAQDLSTGASLVLTTYKSKYPFSKSIAYRNVGSNIVYFNTRKNPRDIGEMVETLCHELMHVLGYEHGNNYSRGKENAVPNRVGFFCRKNVEVCSE